MDRTLFFKIFAGCCLATGSSFAATAADANSSRAVENVSHFTPAPNPQIPYNVNFAGCNVNLDRLDMFERFDREMTSLIYGHSTTLLTIKRANRFFPLIIPILKEEGVPLDMVYLAAVESQFNIRAYSPAKAAGLWQFMATTGKQYGLEVNEEVDERYDPEKATRAACRYLKYGYSKYRDWPTVAASYNAGMARISKELGRQLSDTSFDLYLNEETSRYVFRILAMKVLLENPRVFGFNLTADQLYQPINYRVVNVDGPVESWSEWARLYGVTYMSLKELNPWIRSHSLTNKRGKTYKVKVPLVNELYRSKRSVEVYNKNWIVK